MKESFWNDLLFKIDEELTLLTSQKSPDLHEFSLLKQIDSEPHNLDLQFQLVCYLDHKGRLSDCIPVLLNIIAVDRNFQDQAAYNKLMEIFSKLGSTHEKVKDGRRKLSKIMFWTKEN